MSDTPLPVLDPALNKFPDSPRHIHLMGICGTGMGAVAGLLQQSGYTITGSDSGVYPPMSDYLAENNIVVTEGYGPGNLHPRPDLVVVGNVIRRENPEALELARLGVDYVSFPQLLSHFYLSPKTSLVVAGTHGKTTTSALLATVLAGAELDPSFMIGGIVQAFNANFTIGKGEYFVVEGDEYDTAFFDKGPKFLHYQPHIAILTSVEFDHADIYADFDAVKDSFRKLIEIMPDDGTLIACFDYEVVRELCSLARCRVISYGSDPAFDYCYGDLDIGADVTSFALLRSGQPAGMYRSVLPGKHNVLNSMAVIAVLDTIGVEPGIIARELQLFQGVRRRQEVRGVEDGVVVIDDFAHHPTAVNETLQALAGAYAGKRLVAVFEPRTNSSRRNIFQEDYARVFGGAAEVVIKEPDPLDGVRAEDHFSAAVLAEALKAQGIPARCFADVESILAYLLRALHADDVVAVLSNGGFGNIHARLLDGLRQRALRS
ncbi:MAG: UDP-N-acetylmuramate--L-alanine ligase [Desulfobulbaceae bacterium]|jgi:UDP-N-acetylmuramate: L-alanyl-gamma-D-glutamyl-meso-diaminopimelate ligase|nr:UDP-N-acetylmuramate--L-alanine ligase [Desulfobulbaceae bacterium]